MSRDTVLQEIRPGADFEIDQNVKDKLAGLPCRTSPRLYTALDVHGIKAGADPGSCERVNIFPLFLVRVSP